MPKSASSSDYQEILSSYLLRIDEQIEKILPHSVNSTWLTQTAGQRCMDTDTEQANQFLEPGRSLLKRGGKRWRPLVTILTCEALGGGRMGDALVPLTEIPHNGSLIVDDIEDSSLTRRGAPAVHLEFGTDLAINMGNLMYFLPSIIFENTNIPQEKVMNIMRDWLTTMRRLHLGQGYDILWHRNKSFFPNQASYKRMCRFKTGSLSELAARLGVHVAVSNQNLVEELGNAWADIGIAFQILDDVYNISSGISGKDFGDDIVEGKKSLPVILHIESCPEDAKRLSELFLHAAEKIPQENWTPVKEAIALLEKSGAIEAARKQGEEILHKGKTTLISLLPESNQRNLLLKLIDRFLPPKL